MKTAASHHPHHTSLMENDMTDLVKLTTVKDQQWFDLETITNKGAWNEATLVAMNRRLPNQSAKAMTREAALRITSGALPSAKAILITQRSYKQMRDPAAISHRLILF